MNLTEFISNITNIENYKEIFNKAVMLLCYSLRLADNGIGSDVLKSEVSSYLLNKSFAEFIVREYSDKSNVLLDCSSIDIYDIRLLGRFIKGELDNKIDNYIESNSDNQYINNIMSIKDYVIDFDLENKLKYESEDYRRDDKSVIQYSDNCNVENKTDEIKKCLMEIKAGKSLGKYTVIDIEYGENGELKGYVLRCDCGYVMKHSYNYVYNKILELAKNNKGLDELELFCRRCARKNRVFDIGSKVGKFTIIDIERDEDDVLKNCTLRCNYCGNIMKCNYDVFCGKVRESRSLEDVDILCDKCGPVGCTGLVAGTWLGKLKVIGFENIYTGGKVECILECGECGNIVRYFYDFLSIKIKECLKEGKDLTSLKLRCGKCDKRAGRRKILGLKIGKLVVDRYEKYPGETAKYVLKCEYGHETEYCCGHICILLDRCDNLGIDYSNVELKCDVCDRKKGVSKYLGMRIGPFTVTNMFKNDRGKFLCNLECECGNNVQYLKSHIANLVRYCKKNGLDLSEAHIFCDKCGRGNRNERLITGERRIGKSIGKFTIMRTTTDKNGSKYYVLRCECGNEILYNKASLLYKIKRYEKKGIPISDIELHCDKCDN